MYWRALDIAIHAASNAAHQIVSKTPSPGVAAAGITGDRDILAIDAGTGVGHSRNARCDHAPIQFAT